jgi:hypothetical protein
MGRRTRQGNTIPQKTNNDSVEDLVENEGNESPVSDPTRMMVKCSVYLKRSLKRSSKRISKRSKRGT